MSKENDKPENSTNDESISLEDKLLEMFLQCFELQSEKDETLSLTQLSLMFCRSPFADIQTGVEDFYGESLQARNLVNPLCLRRFLKRFSETFSIDGFAVARVQKPTDNNNSNSIPLSVFNGVWLLKTIIFAGTGGIMTFDSVVENIEKVVCDFKKSPKLSQDYKIFGNPIAKNRVKSLIKACFSLFTIASNGLLEVVSGIGYLKSSEKLPRESEPEESTEKNGVLYLEETLMKNKRSMPLVKLHLKALFAEDSPECLKVTASDGSLFSRLVNRKESFLIKDKTVFLISSSLEREIIGEIKTTLRNTWGVLDMKKLSEMFDKPNSNLYSKLRKSIDTWPDALAKSQNSSYEKDLSFFLSKFSWIFEVKTNGSIDVSKHTVLLLETQDSQILYQMLDPLYKERAIDGKNSKSIVRLLSRCIEELQERKCECLLHQYCERILQIRDDKPFALESKQDVINFLSVFPEFFKISGGLVWLLKSQVIERMKNLEISFEEQCTTTEVSNGIQHDSECSPGETGSVAANQNTEKNLRAGPKLENCFFDEESATLRETCFSFEQNHSNQDSTGKFPKSEQFNSKSKMAESPDTHTGALSCGDIEVECNNVEKSSRQVKSPSTSPTEQLFEAHLNQEATSPRSLTSSSNKNVAVEKTISDYVSTTACNLKMETDTCDVNDKELIEELECLDFKTCSNIEGETETQITHNNCTDFAETNIWNSIDYLSWSLMSEPWGLNLDCGPVFIDFSQPLNMDSGPFVKLDSSKDLLPHSEVS